MATYPQSRKVVGSIFFFDRGHPKELLPNYPTTGNEAARRARFRRPPHRQQRDRYLYLVHGGCEDAEKAGTRWGKGASGRQTDYRQSAGPMRAGAAARRPRRLPGLVPVTAPCTSATASLWATTSRRLSTRFRIPAFATAARRQRIGTTTGRVRRRPYGGYSGARRPRGSGVCCGSPR